MYGIGVLDMWFEQYPDFIHRSEETGFIPLNIEQQKSRQSPPTANRRHHLAVAGTLENLDRTSPLDPTISSSDPRTHSNPIQCHDIRTNHPQFESTPSATNQMRNVPELGCGDELKRLFSQYGEVEEYVNFATVVVY
ncbi:hypothetical protein AKJ16_DCAP19789, partial [Drosera capensis]